MDTERAKKILADSGIEHPVFAERLGIKANSFRMNLSMGRLSKKAVALIFTVVIAQYMWIVLIVCLL